MDRPALKALARFLEETAFLQSADRVLYSGAEYHPVLEQYRDRLSCVQREFVEADYLQQKQFTVRESADEEYDVSLILVSKDSKETEARIGTAAAQTRVGGRLVCFGENELGAARYPKRLRALCGEVESYSKYKSRIVHAVKDEGWDRELAQSFQEQAKLKPQKTSGLHAAPGMFSWQEPDAASQLLVSQFPKSFSGFGADFGAGYGYLSSEVLKRDAGITELHLYDSDAPSLDAAQVNLTQDERVCIHFHWCNVPAGIEEKNFDFIVMNPPFHIGRYTRPDLGEKFVLRAMRSLKSGGGLHMVANKQLPYMRLLQELSSTVERVTSTNLYQVLRAVK